MWNIQGCMFQKVVKIFLNSFDFDESGNVIMPTESGEAKYQKPIEINSENTLIFARGLGTFG